MAVPLTNVLVFRRHALYNLPEQTTEAALLLPKSAYPSR
jgi:hypothetical protein